jgi:hypothetical protein
MFQVFTLSAFGLFLGTSAALAEEGPTTFLHHADWIVFGLSLVLAGLWSGEAFDRPSIKLADVPTFPRYMTRPGQYRLGKAFFILSCVGIYCLMVHYHTDIPAIIGMVQPALTDQLKTFIEQKDPSYLVVTIIVSTIFVALLRYEAKWNVLLMGRSLIYSWVAIPYLANRIVVLTQESLHVPPSAIAAVAENSQWHVQVSDFQQNERSFERAWAELCYVQWWLQEQRKARPESTFFSEKSFAWQDLKKGFDRLNMAVTGLKSSSGAFTTSNAEMVADIEGHREKLGRLVACYLVFMNSARPALVDEAARFGIVLNKPTSENPLAYSAAYILVLAVAVYFGVFFSAVLYDVLHGTSLFSAMQDQKMHDAERWVIYASGMYGAPIIAILCFRYLAWQVSPIRTYSLAAFYAWIVLAAIPISTFGVTFAAIVAGDFEYKGHWDQFFAIALRALPWSLGPALICVYINYFLDRHTDSRLPNIDAQSEPLPLRAFYAMLFTLAIMLLTLPSLPNIALPEGAVWPIGKLRVVSMGTIFYITFALALVAQLTLGRASKRQIEPVGAVVSA